MEIGNDRFILDREFLTDASEGASKLLATIEAKADLGREEAINNFAYAARTGNTGTEMIHDITYQELVSTGRFHLIQSATLRNEIARYFRTAEGTIATRRNLTRDVWRTFRELAGGRPQP